MTVFEDKLVIAVSSRSLFDLDESNTIFEEQGIDAYTQYQRKNEENILEPGNAFPLIKKLLALKDPSTGDHFVEVILLSRNSSDTGLRIFNSIKHYELNITRAAFTNGASPHNYGTAYGAHLFLSTNHADVRKALESNYAAATISDSKAHENYNQQLRIAFDGDAVLFSDESEKIYKQEGLEAFQENEISRAKKPLSAGPFKDFLTVLHRLQKKFPVDNCPIRTALITARNAPAHERVIRTLRSWDIRIDESLFLGGLSKKDFLLAFDADIFFDDQKFHCEQANPHVATGHVPYGIANEKN